MSVIDQIELKREMHDQVTIQDFEKRPRRQGSISDDR